MGALKNEILSSLSYGMYAIGVKDEDRVSACIVSAVFQVCGSPNAVAVCLSHDNYSSECVKKNGLFTISVLSEDTSGAVIGALGFNSGRDADKLRNVRHRVLEEGLPVVKENTCCWFLCKVIESIETPTHTVFIGEVTAGSESAKGKPMTYEFYRRVVKGRAPRNAPFYREEDSEAERNEAENWVCAVCGYLYNDAYVPFEELPDDWACPICGAPKSAFRRR